MSRSDTSAERNVAVEALREVLSTARQALAYIEEDWWDLTREEPDAYADWKYEVGNGDTLLGFADWLKAKREEEEDYGAHSDVPPVHEA